jgi:hypothetical protein
VKHTGISDDQLADYISDDQLADYISDDQVHLSDAHGSHRECPRRR